MQINVRVIYHRFEEIEIESQFSKVDSSDLFFPNLIGWKSNPERAPHQWCTKWPCRRRQFFRGPRFELRLRFRNLLCRKVSLSKLNPDESEVKAPGGHSHHRQWRDRDTTKMELFGVFSEFSQKFEILRDWKNDFLAFIKRSANIRL